MYNRKMGTFHSEPNEIWVKNLFPPTFLLNIYKRNKKFSGNKPTFIYASIEM